MKKRIYAAILAVMFAFLNVVSAIPAAALEGVSQVYATPSGYNENDYQNQYQIGYKYKWFSVQTDDKHRLTSHHLRPIFRRIEEVGLERVIRG